MNSIKIIQLEGETATKAIQKLFNENLNNRNLAHLNWQYNDSPNGSLSLFAQNVKGEIMGTLSVLISKMDHFGNELKIAQAIDAVVDKEFRKNGVFMALLKSMNQQMIDQDIAMIYGFPSKNSAHAFFKRWEFQKLNPTPFKIKILSLNYLLKKIKLGSNNSIDLNIFINEPSEHPSIKTIAHFSSEVNDLWKHFSNNEFIAVKRNEGYLNWRYFDNPSFPYRALGFYDENEKIQGFIIASLQQKHGTNLLYIMELIHRRNKPEIPKALLKSISNIAKKANAEISLCWCRKSYPNHAAFTSANYFNLPEWLRPIELHTGFKPYKKDLKVRRDDFYISYSDSDTV